MNRVEMLAKVLADHREAEVETPRGWVTACDCGWDSRDSDEGEPALWAHVAAALDAALAAQEGERRGAMSSLYPDADLVDNSEGNDRIRERDRKVVEEYLGERGGAEVAAEIAELSMALAAAEVDVLGAWEVVEKTRNEVDELHAKVAIVEALAEEWLEYNPSHGSYLSAGQRLHATHDAEVLRAAADELQQVIIRERVLVAVVPRWLRERADRIEGGQP